MEASRMTSEIFVDVIGSIGVDAGLVRIELTARQAADGETAKRMVPRQRVIMAETTSPQSPNFR
jgi:hypothetical protein